jgi:hypothetical protein
MFPKHKWGLIDLCTFENSTDTIIFVIMMLLTVTPIWLSDKKLHEPTSLRCSS